MQGRVCEVLTGDNGSIKKAFLPREVFLVQAQTEIEAIAKIKMFGLKPNQQIVGELTNRTIL